MRKESGKNSYNSKTQPRMSEKCRNRSNNFDYPLISLLPTGIKMHAKDEMDNFPSQKYPQYVGHD